MTFRYRGLVLLAWIALFALSLFLSKVASVLVTGGFEDTESKSFQSGRLNREVLGIDYSLLMVSRFREELYKRPEQSGLTSP